MSHGQNSFKGDHIGAIQVIMGLIRQCVRSFDHGLHCSKLTWRWRGAPFKATILYIGPSMGFHVNIGEGKHKDPKLVQSILYSS